MAPQGQVPMASSTPKHNVWPLIGRCNVLGEFIAVIKKIHCGAQTSGLTRSRCTQGRGHVCLFAASKIHSTHGPRSGPTCRLGTVAMLASTTSTGPYCVPVCLCHCWKANLKMGSEGKIVWWTTGLHCPGKSSLSGLEQ